MRCLARAADGINDTRKFDEHPVAGNLYDPAVVLRDLWVDELAPMRLFPFERSFLAVAHQPRITHHIGGEDRRETAAGGDFRRVARRRAPVGVPRSNRPAWDISPPSAPYLRGNPVLREGKE